ncbi:MAG: MmgE/PrpD family protein [Acidobacteria bacterium]|nr:MmgE/PrpD family protein [Acidobacteriota bacterium]
MGVLPGQLVDDNSRRLAEYTAHLNYRKLDKDTTHHAKRFLLDTFGCALGRVGAADCRMLHKVVADQGGRKEATIIGTGKRTRPPTVPHAQSTPVANRRGM